MASLTEALIERSQEQVTVSEAPKKMLQAKLRAATAQVEKAMKMALMLKDAAPAMRAIDELERERKRVAAELDDFEEEVAMKKAAAALTREQIQLMLEDFAASADDHRELLSLLVEKVVLDPVTLDCQLHYRIRHREGLASPRGRASYPVISLIERLVLCRPHRLA